jgi:hypothetical protein
VSDPQADPRLDAQMPLLALQMVWAELSQVGQKRAFNINRRFPL